MECQFCHATIEDDAKFCPVCGKDLLAQPEENPETDAAAEEAAAEETAADEEIPAETAPEETADAETAPAEEETITTEDELIPGDPEGKPKKHGAVWIAMICVLAALAVAAAIFLSQRSKTPEERLVIQDTRSYTVANDEMTNEIAGRVVASCRKDGIIEQAKELLGKTAPTADGLTNAQLTLFYWENFYNYYNSNYYYAMYLGLDPANMDTSMYDEDENRTWQEWFLTNALEDYRTYTAVCEKARAEGYVLPEDVAENLNTVRENVNAYSEEEIAEQLLSVYGPGVTREDYLQYIDTIFLGASYINSMKEKIQPTDEDLERYYDEHAEEYADVPKVDSGNASVRHILIAPSDTENEAAWKAAEEKAQKLYEQWKAGDATEDSFAALAQEHSEDPGSAENGGLYEDVHPGQMVEEFNDWCFDQGRKPGDTDIVKTDYGYHIMYYVSEGSEIQWKTEVEADYRSETLNEMVEEISLDYVLRLDLDKVALATPEQVLATTSEEEAEG